MREWKRLESTSTSTSRRERDLFGEREHAVREEGRVERGHLVEDAAARPDVRLLAAIRQVLHDLGAAHQTRRGQRLPQALPCILVGPARHRH